MLVMVADKRLKTSVISHRFRQGENHADLIEIEFPKSSPKEYRRLQWTLIGLSEQKTMASQILRMAGQGDSLILLWEVTQDFTAVPGPLKLELTGTDSEGNLVVKLLGDPVYIAPTFTGEAAEPPGPGAFDQALAELKKQLEQAEEAAARAERAGGKPPVIGEARHWMCWNQEREEYQDTGISAVAGVETVNLLPADGGNIQLTAQDIPMEPDGKQTISEAVKAASSGQGGEGDKTTSFLPDGSILESLDAAEKETRFLSDGRIEEITREKQSGRVIGKKTITFLTDGTIQEVTGI